jgi:NDP-sugar pyrophosphorylase family protein
VIGLCAVILAAGEGRRLRPLTTIWPKALCPVGNTALLDLALARLAGLGFSGPGRVAVNACHLAEQVVSQVAGRATVFVEPAPPWGTSGGLARMRSWVAERAVLVGNADAYLADPIREPGSDIAALLQGWDGETVRLLGVPGGTEFDGHDFAGFSLLPWPVVAGLPDGRGELVHTAWRPAQRAGRLQVVPYAGTYMDTGTPPDYLAANVHAAHGGVLVAEGATVTAPVECAVIGAGAFIEGPVRNAVVWPGGAVGSHETLTDAIRVGADLTVPASLA